MKYCYSIIFLLFFYASGYSQNPCPGIPTVDYGGKTYHTVAIGTQCWLRENLDVGKMISVSQSFSDNGVIEKNCWLDDSTNCTTLGGFYQWNEAMQYVSTASAKGICPSGWHIPTYAEFQTLSATVGNSGNALKAVGQGTGSGAGTNTSGFSALLAGLSAPGGFADSGLYSHFWCSTKSDTSVYNMSLHSFDNSINFDDYYRYYGYSIRCLNNNIVGVNNNDRLGLPKEFMLFQNYPNPFNPTTTINYSLPKEGKVKLTVYNTIGSKVSTIVNEYKPAGNYSVQFNSAALPSGIYFYRIQAGSFVETKKMILLK